MQTRIAAGGVVCTRDPAGQLLILLIHDKYGCWTLPKGHLEAGETEEQAAYREIVEETGIHCTIGPLIRRIRYPIFKKNVRSRKVVAYFLAQAEYATPMPAADEGIKAACWFAPEDALPMLNYQQVRAVVRRALTMLETLS